MRAVVLLLVLAFVAAGCRESKSEPRTLRLAPGAIERLQQQIEKMCAGVPPGSDCTTLRVIVPERSTRSRLPFRLVTRQPVEPDAMDRVDALLRRLTRFGGG